MECQCCTKFGQSSSSRIGRLFVKLEEIEKINDHQSAITMKQINYDVQDKEKGLEMSRMLHMQVQGTGIFQNGKTQIFLGVALNKYDFQN